MHTTIEREKRNQRRELNNASARRSRAKRLKATNDQRAYAAAQATAIETQATAIETQALTIETQAHTIETQTQTIGTLIRTLETQALTMKRFEEAASLGDRLMWMRC